MSVRRIRVLPDPVLRSKCDEIESITDGIRALVRDLLDTVDDPGRAGLSANQIGVSLRTFSWHINGKSGYVINPVIDTLSEELQDGDEGCLSLPGLWYPLKRAAYAKVSGIDLEGNPISIEGEGIMARCLQHEMDHLSGKVYIDRLPGALKRRALADVRKAAW